MKIVLRLLIALMLLAPSAALSQTAVGASGSGFKIGAASGGGEASNVEARCTELGANCIVSEPMNTNDYQVTCTGSGDTPDIDFADSEGVGSKEATTGWSRCDEQYPVASSVGDVDLPTGTAEIDYVMRVDPDSVNHMMHDGSSLSAGYHRLCMRVYRKFSSNYTGFLTCGANKLMEYWSSSATQIQMSEGGGAGANDISMWAASYGNVPSSGDDLQWDECINNWCRLEVCISSASDIKDFDSITLDGYATQVDVVTPETKTWDTFINSPSGTLGELWPSTGYRESCGGTDPATNGYFYLTHAMIAAWTTDSGQTIGAACEVEGGC